MVVNFLNNVDIISKEYTWMNSWGSVGWQFNNNSCSGFVLSVHKQWYLKQNNSINITDQNHHLNDLEVEDGYHSNSPMSRDKEDMVWQMDWETKVHADRRGQQWANHWNGIDLVDIFCNSQTTPFYVFLNWQHSTWCLLYAFYHTYKPVVLDNCLHSN